MSDNPKVSDTPVPRLRKTAAEQAAEQRAVQEPGGVGTRNVEQRVTTTLSIPVKEGQTVSDAVKDYMVANGGFEGEGIVPGPSGAIMEREVREGQTAHMDHPAIDSNPRRGLPPTALQRDMNDPRFDRNDAAEGQSAPTAPVPDSPPEAPRPA